ncbi:MAG: HAD-IIIA family hydrolase [Verrucomicrobiota bacterium]
MRLAVFLERDGLLNHVRVERNQPVVPLTVEEFQINNEAVEPLKELKAAGFLLIATTNQPGVSRGYLPRRELDLMHFQLKRAFPLDDILVCPHDAGDRCPCRKPQPGLLQEASFKWHLDLDHSFVISDKWQDAAAAQAEGCTSLLIKSPWNGNGHYDFLMPSLKAAVAKILRLGMSLDAQGMVAAPA